MVISVRNSIRHLRKNAGYTQEELAIKCNVTRQTINAIENNKYDPTLELAFRLAKILCVKVDELFSPE
jgi:putative transcriptional regulator